MARKKRSKAEHILQVNVVKLLRAYGRTDIAWWAVPNGGYRDWQTAKDLKEEGVKDGVHDVHFLIDAKFITLELKTEKGKLSEAQDDFAQDVQRAGGFTFVAYGLNEAIGVLHGIKAFRPGISFAGVIDVPPVKRTASRRRASPKLKAA